MMLRLYIRPRCESGEIRGLYLRLVIGSFIVTCMLEMHHSLMEGN